MEIFFFTNFETFEMTTMVKLKNVENAGERQLCIMDIYMANAGKRLSQFLANKNIIFPDEYCEWKWKIELLQLQGNTKLKSHKTITVYEYMVDNRSYTKNIQLSFTINR